LFLGGYVLGGNPALQAAELDMLPAGPGLYYGDAGAFGKGV
jgi:hypothetical protein